MADDKELERFGEAVEKKKRDAEQADLPEEQPERLEPGRTQDERDVRAKGSGHGKKTADKWNQ